MQKYTTKYDTLKLHNNTCYNSTKGKNPGAWSSSLLEPVTKFWPWRRQQRWHKYNIGVWNKEQKWPSEKEVTWLFARKLKMTKPLLMQSRLCMLCSSFLESPEPSKPWKIGYNDPTMYLTKDECLELLIYLITEPLVTSCTSQWHKKSLHNEPDKDDNIKTVQYMESKK